TTPHPRSPHINASHHRGGASPRSGPPDLEGTVNPAGQASLTSVGGYDYSDLVAMLVRYWRDRRGYSVRQLAERGRVGFSTVTRIENGRLSPTVAMLEKLATALGITVRDFFPVERPKARRSKR